MRNKNYDFGGYATRNDILCADGRIIKQNAFKDNDGKKVPIVWSHGHQSIDNVLGHAYLENRSDGVYAYGYLNKGTKQGKKALSDIQHGAINALSIYANKLQSVGANVMHGDIVEVSLVIAGANPGATIDTVSLAHSKMGVKQEEAVINFGEIFHSVSGVTDDEDVDGGEDMDLEELVRFFEEEMTEEEQDDFLQAISDDDLEEFQHALDLYHGNTLQHSDDEYDEEYEDDDDDSYDDEDEDYDVDATEVYEDMSPVQKAAVRRLVELAYDDGVDEGFEEAELEIQNDELGHSLGGTTMRNLFENTNSMEHQGLINLEKDAIKNVLETARSQQMPSLKQAVLAHGVTQLDTLFPESKVIGDPQLDLPDDAWVANVMGGVGTSPFSRIKTINTTDLTVDAARAKGYVTGDEKTEEVFGLINRETSPVTVYKKQSIDRDNVVDITTIDVVVWLKREMRTLLQMELARAILIGDGRAVSHADKIKEANIRPIYTDSSLYTIPARFTIDADADDLAFVKAYRKAALTARKDYKGRGNPTLYISNEALTRLLLATDTVGRVLYDTVEKLATALRVRDIVEVPVMDGITRVDATKTYVLGGIIVNLKDYNVGKDKNGETNMFDDFDIDFNKYKYLIETRMSGALVNIRSAIVVEYEVVSKP